MSSDLHNQDYSYVDLVFILVIDMNIEYFKKLIYSLIYFMI